jgi:hypothetical protein
MAYSVELVGRRLTKGQSPQGLLKYQVWAGDAETIDQSTAYGLVHAASPSVFEGLVKQNINVEEISDEIYSGDVQYGVLPKGEAGDDPGWSFEIGGATQHLTHSLETVASYAPDGKTAPDHKGAIGVRRTGNGGLSVDGVDIDVDTFTWEETHYFPLAAITPAYIQTLKTVRGGVNDDPWRIWQKGEVRLDAVTGRKRGEEDVALTFRFSESDSVTGLTIGDITGIAKEGWQYLWVFYQESDDTSAGALAMPPQAVYVERVRRLRRLG